jgi:hypothetical protein
MSMSWIRYANIALLVIYLLRTNYKLSLFYSSLPGQIDDDVAPTTLTGTIIQKPNDLLSGIDFNMDLDGPVYSTINDLPMEIRRKAYNYNVPTTSTIAGGDLPPRRVYVLKRNDLLYRGQLRTVSGGTANTPKYNIPDPTPLTPRPKAKPVNTTLSINNHDPIQPNSQFAYVFFLSWVTPNATQSYLGEFYNILVSVQILRDSGSKADMILLVHTPVHNGTLPQDQTTMLQALDIRIRYVPNTSFDPDIYAGSVALEKFRILNWAEYKRIIFLEANIMPHCSLDYLFDMSVEGQIQNNLLISIGKQPVSSHFFLIEPTEGAFHQFLIMVAKYPHVKGTPDWQFPRGEWTSLYLNLKEEESDYALGRGAWNFPDNYGGVGLFYTWMLYRNQQMTLLVGEHVYTAERNSNLLGPRPNPLTPACSRQDTKQQYHSDKAQTAKYVSPEGVAPYADIAQWEYDDTKPWHLTQINPEKTAPASHKWLKVLQSLDEHHHWNLGLAASGGKQWKHVLNASAPIIEIPSNVTLLEEWANSQVLVHVNATGSSNTEQRGAT